MRIAIIVVLYDKEIDKSSTIKTLIDNGIKDSQLIIHNNGPYPISLPPELVSLLHASGVSCSLVNCVENKPLANLYNDFINEHHDFDKFIFLDDDSQLTKSFIDAMYSNDCDLELPRIVSISDNETYYPISKGKVIRIDGFLEVLDTFSIGSGLMLSRIFVEKYFSRNMNVFDENYALYGVDVSLFRRMWKMKKQGEDFKIKTSSTIIHSLSRTEGPESDFRRKERLIDYAVSVRRYPSLRGYASFIKKGLTQLVTLRITDFSLMSCSFVSGMHPRSKLWNKSKKPNARK